MADLARIHFYSVSQHAVTTNEVGVDAFAEELVVLGSGFEEQQQGAGCSGEHGHGT